MKEEKDANQREVCDSFHAERKAAEFPWTVEEDDNLKILVNSFGKKNWKVIASVLPGRTEMQCMSRWTNHLNSNLVKRKLSTEKDTKDTTVGSEGDATLDGKPGTPGVVRPESQSHQGEHPKAKRKCVPLPKASERDLSTPSPSLPAGSASSPSPTSGSAKFPVAQEDQKRFADAALRMVAEEMLPLSFVEGAGFRSFMSTISPQYNKLSQRAIGMLLYEDVERVLKPQLIRELSALTKSKESGGCIHVTFDLWLSGQSQPEEDPIVVVQLHFINDSWQIRRPVVAFRHLSSKDLNAALSKELEGVLLSYGIFPQSIGYVLANPAKQALATNSLFCDYKIMCSSSRGEPDGDQLVAFLSDQHCEEDSHFSEVQIGTKAMCVARGLQIVVKEALKTSRVVENLLSQIYNVVAFFKNSTYWSEVLLKEYKVSLYPPLSSCRWNSMMMSLRRIVQPSSWTSVMTLLTHARTEADDTASAPPLVMAKREQVTDILRLLEPFEEALQVLQGNGVTISYIVPSLVGLDKTLENVSTNYSHFCKALRQGLCTQFQSLVHETDMVLAAVLDPRIKLQPFAEVKAEKHTGFLTPPAKHEACSIVQKVLGDMDTHSSPAVTSECTETMMEVKEEKLETEILTNVEQEEPDCSSDSSWCNDVGENDLKRKSIFNFLQPPAKKSASEFDVYLSESLSESNCSINMHWQSAHQFPRLQSIAKRLLAVPATSGGFDRLCPIATSIVRARRNRLPVHTTERLLLYKHFIKAKSAKRHSAGAKQ